MKVLLMIVITLSLSAWSFSSMARGGVGSEARGYNDPDTEEQSQVAVIDAIYPKEARVVIDDREYFIEGSIAINGQEISAGGATAVLREGQRLLKVFFEPEGENEYLVLKGVDTL